MRRLRFTTEALENLSDIAVHVAISSGSRGLAEKFVGRLRRKCADLAAFPGVPGRARPELRQDIRSHAHGNYVIFFRVGPEFIEIVTVMEGHRDIDTHFRKGGHE